MCGCVDMGLEKEIAVGTENGVSIFYHENTVNELRAIEIAYIFLVGGTFGKLSDDTVN